MKEVRAPPVASTLGLPIILVILVVYRRVRDATVAYYKDVIVVFYRRV